MMAKQHAVVLKKYYPETARHKSRNERHAVRAEH